MSDESAAIRRRTITSEKTPDKAWAEWERHNKSVKWDLERMLLEVFPDDDS